MRAVNFPGRKKSPGSPSAVHGPSVLIRKVTKRRLVGFQVGAQRRVSSIHPGVTLYPRFRRTRGIGRLASRSVCLRGIAETARRSLQGRTCGRTRPARRDSHQSNWFAGDPSVVHDFWITDPGAPECAPRARIPARRIAVREGPTTGE